MLLKGNRYYVCFSLLYRSLSLTFPLSLLPSPSPSTLSPSLFLPILFPPTFFPLSHHPCFSSSYSLFDSSCPDVSPGRVSLLCKQFFLPSPFTSPPPSLDLQETRPCFSGSHYCELGIPFHPLKPSIFFSIVFLFHISSYFLFIYTNIYCK